jgi:hypothetical protein
MEDFMWWSNLSTSDVRKATDFIKSNFSLEKTDTGTYLIPDAFSLELSKNADVHLLPAYDEFLISYRDRSSSLAAIYNKKTVSDNGIFYPLIVINGQIEGTWKRSIKKSKLYIDPVFFKQPDKHNLRIMKKKANLLGTFLNKDTEIRIKEE